MVADADSASKPRSRKIYVLWATALTLLLTAGFFCWLVVVPVLRIPSECEKIQAAGFDPEFLQFPAEAGRQSVRRLGGPARAGLALRIHLWVHGDSGEDADVVVFLMDTRSRQTVPALVGQLDSLAPHRFYVVLHALGELGPRAADAVPALLECFGNRYGVDRCYMAETLGQIGAAAASAVPRLTSALDNEDEVLRCCCADALGEIGVSSKEVISRLEALAAGDKSSEVRKAAAKALEKIEREVKK